MTNYQQTANPDATNSELDAKKIVNNVQLNNDQFGELIQQYVELVVDNMSEKDLVRYAQEQLIDALNQYSIDELKEDVDNFDEDLFDELVDNVTNEVFIDVNNNGGKF